MRRVNPIIETVSFCESAIGGLRSGYLLIDSSMLDLVRRCSSDGNFFPYAIDKRLPEFDKGELIAVQVELIPLIKPPN